MPEFLLITGVFVFAVACRTFRQPAIRKIGALGVMAASFLIGFTALTVFISAFFFTAPLESIANPQVTPLHTVAPWYFYWLQGLLKIADKTIANAIKNGPRGLRHRCTPRACLACRAKHISCPFLLAAPFGPNKPRIC